ncbi:hypothetical protein VPH35_012585 [Triticum aestivum]
MAWPTRSPAGHHDSLNQPTATPLLSPHPPSTPQRNRERESDLGGLESNPIQSKAEVEIKPTGDEVLLGVRPVAGVLPPGVGPHLALPRRLRRHGGPHHQDDRRLHQGGPQELQVRPGAQEEVVAARPARPPPGHRGSS